MSLIDQPAQPGEGNQGLPSPSLPDINTPAQPDEGPSTLPTPSLPDNNSPAQPGEGPVILPTPSLPSQPITIRRCPSGYRQGVVRNNQSFTDLLLEYDVSFNAMRAANPLLPTTRIAPGTVFCAPPVGTRRLCSSGNSYILNQNETLDSLAATWGIAPATLLRANPNLAPGDFVPGRVICLP